MAEPLSVRDARMRLHREGSSCSVKARQNKVDDNLLAVLIWRPVAIGDWIDIPGLQGQSRHLSAVAGVLASLFIITHLAKLFFGEGTFVTGLVYFDDFLSALGVVFYGSRLVYDMLKREWGRRHGNLILVA